MSVRKSGDWFPVSVGSRISSSSLEEIQAIQQRPLFFPLGTNVPYPTHQGSRLLRLRGLTPAACLDLFLLQRETTIPLVELDRAKESLSAAELCLQGNLVNSSASRAYYAMFQAGQIALEAEGLTHTEWSHKGLHSTFNQELIRQKKVYPQIFRNYLTSALTVRQAADYGEAGVSAKIAERQLRRATAFVKAVEEVTSRGKSSKS